MADTKISDLTQLSSSADLGQLYIPLFKEDGSPDNASILASTMFQAVKQLTIAPAWSGAGVGTTPLVVNVTDPGNAANAASKLLDLQVGGSSKFSVTKAGYINTSYVANTNQQHVLGGWNLGSDGNGPVLNGTQSGAHRISRASSPSSAGIYLYQTGGETTQLMGRVGLGGATAQDPMLFFHGDAAYVLAQRDGANGNTFRAYRTFTNSSTFERGTFGWHDSSSDTGTVGNTLRIGTEKGSASGTARPVSLIVGGVEAIGIAGADGEVSIAGSLKFGTHSAIAAETVTGYITIKDASGTTRKLAVVS